MKPPLLLLSLALAAGLAACQRPTAPKAALPPAAAAPHGIRLDDLHRREAGVALATAGPQLIADTLTVYGEIRPAAERIRRVAARYPGIARKVLKNIGDHVSAGETLLVVESNDSLEPYRISAPISGRVLERAVNEGESLDGQTLFTIGDLSVVWAELAVFPHDAAAIRIGQAVEVYADRNSAAQRGALDYIAPDSDPQRRSVRVRATLDNSGGTWRPGQFISAELVLVEHPAAIAVPQSALQDIDGQPSVFVEGKDGGFMPRALKLGAQDRHYAEVRAGLQAGERIVSANSFLLKSEWLSSGGE